MTPLADSFGMTAKSTREALSLISCTGVEPLSIQTAAIQQPASGREARIKLLIQSVNDFYI